MDPFDEINTLEKLLGMPQGSTKKLNPDEIAPAIAQGIENKTKDLADKAKQINALESLDAQDKLKSGITDEQLDEYRREHLEDAQKVKKISMKLLTKLEKDIEDKIVVDPKLWASVSPMLTSVMTNIKTLSEMVTRYRQEEEMRRLTTISQETTEEDKIQLSPTSLAKLISEHKQRQGSKDNIQATDAEIVEKPKDNSGV